MSLRTGLRLAVGTLTIIRVGELGALPAGAGRVAMLAAPLAVSPIAVAAGSVLWLASLAGAPALVAAGLFVTVVAVLTRAMHLDGFADTIDGLGGGWTRERALEIMRRGDVGPMGAAGLALLLLIQAGALSALVPVAWAGLVAGVALCGSRVAVTVLCVRPVPAARTSGLGSVVASSVPVPAAALGAIAAAAALCGALVLSGVHWWWGLVAAASAAAALGILLVMVLRKLGGVTGDVLGAGIEVAFTVLLVVLSIAVAA